MRTPDLRLAGGRVDRTLRILSEGGHFHLWQEPFPLRHHYGRFPETVTQVALFDSGDRVPGIGKGTYRTFRVRGLLTRWPSPGRYPQTWVLSARGADLTAERREKNKYGAWA